MFAIKNRVITSLLTALTLTLFGPVSPTSANGDTPQDVSINNILGVTPPVANASPVETITPNNQFTGTVFWEDKDGPLVGNFKSSTIYKATISLSAASGYTFDNTPEIFFTVAGATNVSFYVYPETPTAGEVFAYFIPGFGTGADYLDNSFATNGTFDLLDIFGSTPLNENNSAVGPLQVDRMAIDSQDRILVLGSFYSDTATRFAIGAGYRNSLAIAAQSGNESTTSAAVAALAYRGGGKSDWYLPSMEELAELSTERATVGLIGEDLEYWSSVEDGINAAAVYLIDQDPDGAFSWSTKDQLRGVRAIRAGTLDTATVGDAGPGGGIIFYVTTTAFACGPTLFATCNYLEAAPSDWFSDEGDPLMTWATTAENQVASVSIDHHILFRLNADGSYDNTFGNPGTTLRKDSGDTPKRYVPITTTGSAYTEKVDLEIDSDDKILVMLSGTVIGADYGKYHNFVARYNSTDGMIDTSFGDGNDGAIGSTSAQDFFVGDVDLGIEPLFKDFTIDSNDRILTTSSYFSPGSIEIARFLTDGSLDDSFGETESGTTLVDLIDIEDSSLTFISLSNFQIIADGANGYIAAFSGFVCGEYSDNEACLFEYPATEFFRLDQSGSLDDAFNTVGYLPESLENFMPLFAFTELIPDGPTGFILSGTYALPNQFGLTSTSYEPFGFSQTFGLMVRLGINGEPDTAFSGGGISEFELQPLISNYCSNSALSQYPGSSQSSNSSIYVGEYCLDNDDETYVHRLKTFSASGQYLGGFTLREILAEDYAPRINQVKVASDGKLLILSGAQPSSGFDAALSQLFPEDISYSEVRISRYQFGENAPPPSAPAPTSSVASSPTLTPYLKTLTAPKIALKGEKLTCLAGTYNSGFTLSGVNQGSATSLATPSSFTYKIFIDGIAQDSLTVISESATASWKTSVAPAGALVTCSVAASVNGVTNLDRSTDNNVGVAAAMSAQVSAIKTAQISYPESLTANTKAYQKALVDNRTKWRSDTEKNRRDYRAKLEKIKSLSSKEAKSASASSAFKSFSATRKKIVADYTAGIPAALVAKELADRNALLSREAAITKAQATCSSFIESVGYGVLIP